MSELNQNKISGFFFFFLLLLLLKQNYVHKEPPLSRENTSQMVMNNEMFLAGFTQVSPALISRENKKQKQQKKTHQNKQTKKPRPNKQKKPSQEQEEAVPSQWKSQSKLFT